MAATNARFLSIDPGLANLGWCVLSFPDPLLSAHGISSLVTSGTMCELLGSVEDFFNSVIVARRAEYDKVVIERQPFISMIGTADQRARNFKLQLVDVYLRGLVTGARIPLQTYCPRAMRVKLGLSRGDYALNKKATVDWVINTLGIPLKSGKKESIPKSDQRCHVADCIAGAVYCGNMFLTELPNEDSDESTESPQKRRKTLAVSDHQPSSPSVKNRAGCRPRPHHDTRSEEETRSIKKVRRL